jgi:hypothetical protein
MLRVSPIRCEGAPRDLGADQGRACRDEIRADLGALTRSHPDPFLVRDLARYFPHLDERVSGLASGADAQRDALVALLASELVDCAGLRVARDGAAIELRTDVVPPTGWIVRTTHAEGGYANLTVTRPGLVFALAGVNEHGLAGALAAIGPVRPDERWRVPGALLLEQCIERLDAVEKALEWCERRPGGGSALLVFADASGVTEAIQIDGEKRTRDPTPAHFAAASVGGRVRLDPAKRAMEIEGAGRFVLDQGAAGEGAGGAVPGASPPSR